MHRTATASRHPVARLAVAIGAASLALAGCVAVPPTGPEPEIPCGALSVDPMPRCDVQAVLQIDEAIVSQRQALPDFDGGPYVVDDPALLDDLEATLGPSGARDQMLGDSCPGSRSTTIQVIESSVGPFTIEVGACTDDPFVEELDALVAGWIAAGGLEPAP